MATYTNRISGVRSELAIKAPVRVATTANITLSGWQTIDGVTLADGDSNLRVLVKNQTDQTTNGIYLANSGVWQRDRDFDANGDFIYGTRILVTYGTSNQGQWMVSSADPISIGTSNITFTSANQIDQNPGGLTALALADDTADYFSIWDTSASQYKKLLGQNLGFTGAGTATLRSLQSKLRDVVSVLDYGADNTGTTDSLTAFTNALAAGYNVLVPNGTYLVSAAIAIPTGHSIIGQNSLETIIKSTSTTAAVITLADGANSCEVSRLRIDRSVVPTSTAYGIDMLGGSDRILFRDLNVRNQYIGLVCQSTASSLIENVVAEFNYSHGFYFTNTLTSTAVQWNLLHCLSQYNDGNGYLVQSTAGPAGCILGAWVDVQSFANTGRGAYFLGNSTTPVYDIRLHGCFFGGDGANEVDFDTYATGASNLHFIADTFTELAGTQTTGHTTLTAASGVGAGINVTANNPTVTVSNCFALQHSQSGMVLSAGNFNQVVGGFCAGNGGYGIAFADGTKAAAIGVRFNGNTTAATNVASNSSSAIFASCSPASVNGTAGLPTGTSGGTIPLLNGVNTWSGAQTFPDASVFTVTDPSATVGPTVYIKRLSASPAAADLLGRLDFQGNNSSSSVIDYVVMNAQITSPTTGTEASQLDIWTYVGGTQAQRVHIGGGLFTDGVTGGDKGAGTINAATLYQAGTALGTAATKNTGTSGTVVPLLDGTNTWSNQQTLSTALNLTGGNIIFPASQVSAAGANTLDDYEEGTWSPIISGASSSGAGTYTTQVGRYTKVGNMVRISGLVAISTHSGTGNMLISLPFTSVNTANAYSAMPLGVDALTYSGQVAALIPSNSATMGIFSLATTLNAAPVTMDTACGFYIGGTYEVPT